MRDVCHFPELREKLRETLRHIARLRRMTPNDTDLVRLEAALRDRLEDLEDQHYPPQIADINGCIASTLTDPHIGSASVRRIVRIGQHDSWHAAPTMALNALLMKLHAFVMLTRRSRRWPRSSATANLVMDSGLRTADLIDLISAKLAMAVGSRVV